MVLIIGGAKQGKLRYVLEKTGLREQNVVEDIKSASTERILYALQYAVREALNTGVEPFSALEKLLTQNPDVIIICDEVGGGIVPAHPDERILRETVGRLCCMLAERATHVERIFCSISMRLKGDDEWA